MLSSKRVFIGVAVLATAAMTVLSVGTAQAASGKGKPTARVAAVRASDSLAPDRVAGVRVVTSAAADSALATMQTRIANYVAKHGTAYSFASYVDATTGRIVLNTDAPAKVVTSLTNMSRSTTALRQAASKLQLHHTAVSDSFNRRDDVPSFWGGAGLAAEGFLCSAGYAVQDSAGTRFMTTAGHCFNNGAGVNSESGASFFGTVSNRHLPTITGDAKDMELIGGSSYAGRIYTGGVTSTSSIPVVAAGTAFVGFNNYCHSGRTTGENCGHTATSLTGQVCTQTGCKSPVIVFTGGNMIQGGDSGGTFYVTDASGAWIRGNVIASGGGTGYVTPWTVVTATLGVSIVLG